MYRCCVLPIATIYAFFDFVLWIHFGWHACFLVFYCIIASCLTLIRVVAWTVSAFCFHGKVLMESQLLQGGGSESQTAAFSWHQSGTLFMFLVVGWLLVLLLLFFFFWGGEGAACVCFCFSFLLSYAVWLTIFLWIIVNNAPRKQVDSIWVSIYDTWLTSFIIAVLLLLFSGTFSWLKTALFCWWKSEIGRHIVELGRGWVGA